MYTQERERERESSKTWLWITLTLVLAGGVGAGVYFYTKQTETKTQTFEERVQEVNNHLADLQEISAILDLGIAQTESTLETKKQEQISNPSDSNLQTEINQLEQQLTTYKTQKGKIETILPKLEQQTIDFKDKEQLQKLEQEIKNINQEEIRSNLKIKISDLSNSTYQDLVDDTTIIQRYLENLNKINEANPNNLTKNADGSSKYQTEKIKCQRGLQEIKDIRAKFMGLDPDQHDIIDCRTNFRQTWSNIFDPKAPKKPDNPTPPNPNNSQNIQIFQTLRGESSKLNDFLKKINQDYQEMRDNYNALPQVSRDMMETMFKDYISIKNWINSLTPLNNGKLNEYTSDSDYQIFLSASPATQKANLELFESNFALVLKETKESLENIFVYMEKTKEFIKDWIKNLEEGRPHTDFAISQAQLQLGKIDNAIIYKDAQFQNFNQKTIAKKIEATEEIYQELERIDWKNVKRS